MHYSDIQTSKMTKTRKLKGITVGQILLRILIAFMAIVCAIPVLLIIIVAFSSEESIAKNGFSFFPEVWSLEAFQYVGSFATQIIRAYGVTIYETLAGSLLTVFITSMFAYVLSQRDFTANEFAFPHL